MKRDEGQEHLSESEYAGYLNDRAYSAEIERLKEALRKIAAPYDGDDATWPVPLHMIGAELRKRQNIAKDALK